MPGGIGRRCRIFLRLNADLCPTKKARFLLKGNLAFLDCRAVPACPEGGMRPGRFFHSMAKAFLRIYQRHLTACFITAFLPLQYRWKLRRTSGRLPPSVFQFCRRTAYFRLTTSQSRILRLPTLMAQFSFISVPHLRHCLIYKILRSDYSYGYCNCS
mgnify:CR=1 FL=1